MAALRQSAARRGAAGGGPAGRSRERRGHMTGVMTSASRPAAFPRRPLLAVPSPDGGCHSEVRRVSAAARSPGARLREGASAVLRLAGDRQSAPTCSERLTAGAAVLADAGLGVGLRAPRCMVAAPGGPSRAPGSMGRYGTCLKDPPLLNGQQRQPSESEFFRPQARCSQPSGCSSHQSPGVQDSWDSGFQVCSF